VELEKSAGVVVGVELEVEVSVGVLEGERLVVVTPKVGVLTLKGSEALVMAVLEDGDALETGGVTGDAGGFEGLVTLEDGSGAEKEMNLAELPNAMQAFFKQFLISSSFFKPHNVIDMMFNTCFNKFSKTSAHCLYFHFLIVSENLRVKIVIKIEKKDISSIIAHKYKHLFFIIDRKFILRIVSSFFL
jgi:hypothetical protein